MFSTDIGDIDNSRTNVTSTQQRLNQTQIQTLTGSMFFTSLFSSENFNLTSLNWLCANFFRFTAAPVSHSVTAYSPVSMVCLFYNPSSSVVKNSSAF